MLTPYFFTPIAESAASPPKLFVIVDTEEEFDWSAPFARENVSVTAIPEVGRLQEVVERLRAEADLRGGLSGRRHDASSPDAGADSRTAARAGLARICTRG